MSAAKRALIIGGGGEIGTAIAGAFRAKSVDVDITVTGSRGRCVSPSSNEFELDVTQPSSVETVLGDYLDTHDLDYLVYNAGVNVNALLVTTSDDEWNRVIAVNLTGAFLVLRTVLPHFLARRRGSIVLISSFNREGAAGSAAYASSKAGLIGLAGTVAKEYGPRGIRCNVVSPGFVESGMSGDLSPTLKDFWQSNCPQRRFCRPDEVAGPVVQLCADDFSFVNGAVIPITGGLDWRP